MCMCVWWWGGGGGGVPSHVIIRGGETVVSVEFASMSFKEIHLPLVKLIIG